MYSFWQYELCDVFIELIKPVMSSGDGPTQLATRETLWTCLEQGLRSALLFHALPTMLPAFTREHCFLTLVSHVC